MTDGVTGCNALSGCGYPSVMNFLSPLLFTFREAIDQESPQMSGVCVTLPAQTDYY